MGIPMHEGHVVSDQISDPGENYHPYTGAQCGIDREFQNIHPGEASRERDILADAGNEPANEGADLAGKEKEVVNLPESLRGKKEILPILQEQRPAEPQRYQVIEKGSQQAAEDPAEDHQIDIHLAL